MPYRADEPLVRWIANEADLKSAVRDFAAVVGIDSEFKRCLLYTSDAADE